LIQVSVLHHVFPMERRSTVVFMRLA
jgi:hypothetical protein